MDANQTCRTNPTGGNVPWMGCCRTDLANEPLGKCGISVPGSDCVERRAPGNPDNSCGGTFRIGFGSFNVIGGGNGSRGCCQWRTGICGVFDSDFGCVQVDYVPGRTPCTPDYSMGISD
jgi:hypothetical protein